MFPFNWITVLFVSQFENDFVQILHGEREVIALHIFSELVSIVP